MSETVPPQSKDAEESVLGSMLISEGAIGAVLDVLDGTEFYFHSHGKIFKAALGLYAQGRPVDVVTMIDRLHELGELDDVGGRVRLHELGALVPASSNAAHYARIVRELAIVRGLIRAGQEITRLGWDRPGTVEELAEQAEAIVFDATQARQSGDLVAAKDIIGETWRNLMHLFENGRDVIGTPTGYKVIDDLTSGLQPGNLVVLAARPSMGKSGLALGMAANVTLRQGVPAALFTLEMSKQEVMQRLLAGEALVDGQKIRNGRGLVPEDWQKLTAASERIEKAPLFIDDSALLTIGEIRSKARRLKMRNPDLGLVVVDYLQLMASTGNEENRNQEIGRISRALKILARDLEVPVLALSQLSRGVEQRHDKRPILSDLRDSGAIEQDADVVMFIYRDEYYNPEETDQQGLAEVNVAKQRNGPTGTVKLSFVKRHARFTDLAPGP
jgi:replicative DNA helicase